MPLSLAAQSALLVQDAGALALSNGKYCRPTPSPADALSVKNVSSAVFTASHLLRLPAVGSSIELETSSMMYMSSGVSLAVDTSAAQVSNEPLPALAGLPTSMFVAAPVPFPALPPLLAEFPALAGPLGCASDPQPVIGKIVVRTEATRTVRRTPRYIGQ